MTVLKFRMELDRTWIGGRRRWPTSLNATYRAYRLTRQARQWKEDVRNAALVALWQADVTTARRLRASARCALSLRYRLDARDRHDDDGLAKVARDAIAEAMGWARGSRSDDSRIVETTTALERGPAPWHLEVELRALELEPALADETHDAPEGSTR